MNSSSANLLLIYLFWFLYKQHYFTSPTAVKEIPDLAYLFKDWEVKLHPIASDVRITSF